MDVTPELLTEYKFKEEWRGYNRDEVDDFLERLAAALGEFQARYEQMARRAEAAEQHPPESGNEEQLRRTLVLAQRTADAVLEEAKAEAAELLARAEERARAVVEDAEQRASSLEADVIERTREELGSIATRRAELSLEVEALDAFVSDHRGRLQAELREQLNWLARPGRLELPPAPPLSPLPEAIQDVEEPLDEFGATDTQGYEYSASDTQAYSYSDGDAQGYEGFDSAEADTYEQPAGSYAAAPADRYPGPDEESYEWDVVPQAWQRELEAERADRGAAEQVDGDPTGEVEVVEANGHVGFPSNGHYGNGYNGANGHDDASFAPEGAYRYAESGPSADDEPEGLGDETRADFTEIDDDPFLAELRRAVTDPEPLGPRDADPSSWDNGPTSGEHFPAADLFGRKRRR